MSSNLALKSEPAPLVACTVSRDIQDFDLLIEDMEAVLGEAWGDLSFGEAAAFIAQPDAATLEFLAIAIDPADEDRLSEIHALISKAKSQGIKVILVTEDLAPIILHELLRSGTDDFVPYPLPEGALEESIARLREPEVEPTPEPEPQPEPVVVQEQPVVAPLPKTSYPASARARAVDETVFIAVHGLSGGAGATTLAVNLAWEMATNSDFEDNDLRIGVLDLDLQFGTVSTYLDLPRRDLIFEILSDTVSMDDEAFKQALLDYEEKIKVFTSPSDMIPLDIVEPENIDALMVLCKQNFDIVIIDMPTTLVQWTETVLERADMYFAVVEMELRAAQNALRFIKALKSEDLPIEKINWVLNRAPKPRDSGGQSRVKRLAESLDVTFSYKLPDGGIQVRDVNDEGGPLAEKAPKNPLRKEITQIAATLLEVMHTDEAEVARAAKKKKGKSIFSLLNIGK